MDRISAVGAAIVLVACVREPAAGSVDGETATTPNDRAVAQQAERCGIKPDQIIWTTDRSGERYASITPNGDLDGLSFQNLKCILDWGQRTGARVGFISEPPESAEKAE
ncbi:MAG TPA: hypothetical protein VF589_07815 [Allosphingosinicella sp.]|jgi:hypothetical protein